MVPLGDGGGGGGGLLMAAAAAAAAATATATSRLSSPAHALRVPSRRGACDARPRARTKAAHAFASRAL
jgi:hypothetical protein